MAALSKGRYPVTTRTSKYPRKLRWSGILNRQAFVSTHPVAKIALGALLLGYSWYAGITRGVDAWAFVFLTQATLVVYLIMFLLQSIWTIGQWFTSSKPSRWYLFWLFPDALLTAYDFAERLDNGLARIVGLMGYSATTGIVIASILGSIVGVVAAKYGERLILDSQTPTLERV